MPWTPVPAETTNHQWYSDSYDNFLPVLPTSAGSMATIRIPKNCQNLAQWGTALISHGNTWKGESYLKAYSDLSYRTWCKTHGATAKGALKDFCNYCDLMDVTRQA